MTAAGRLLLLLGLAGCSGPDPATIDLSQEGRHLGFVLRTAQDGVVAGVEGPFGLEDGRLWFGRRPQFAVSGEAGALVVVFDLDEVAAARPGFTLDRAEDVTLVPGADPLERAEGDGTLIGRVPFPASTRIWRVMPGAAPQPMDAEAPERLALTEAWQVGLPFDPEHCRDTLGRALAPWRVLDALVPLAGDDLDIDLRAVAALDRDRVLATSGGALFVVERDRSATARDISETLPARVVTTEALWPELTAPVVQALVTDLSETPSTRALALVRDADEAEDRTRLAHLSLTADGISAVRTSTTLPGDLEVIAVDEGGRFAIGGTGGRVYFGAFGRVALEVERIPDAAGERFRAAVATGNPAAPWVLTGRAALYERVAEPGGRWTQAILSRVGESLHLEGLAAAGPADGRQLWAGGTSGILYARTGGVWARAMPAFPPRLAPCGVATDGPRPIYEDTIDALDITDGALSIISDDCTGLVRVRLHDGCSTVLQLGDRPIEPAEGALDALSSRDGQLVAVSRRGEVWSLP